MQQAAKFDHGMLNIPLAKRGNIDAQIDAYKAGQARDARAKAKADAIETKAQRIQAKALVEAMTPEAIARVAAKVGVKPAKVRKSLMSDAHWQPAFILRCYGASA